MNEKETKKEHNFVPLIYIVVLAFVAFILSSCYIYIAQVNNDIEISKMQSKKTELEIQNLELERKKLELDIKEVNSKF